MLMLITFLCVKGILKTCKRSAALSKTKTNQSHRNSTMANDTKNEKVLTVFGRTGSEGVSKRRCGFELDFCTTLFAFNVIAVELRRNSAEKRFILEKKSV